MTLQAEAISGLGEMGMVPRAWAAMSQRMIRQCESTTYKVIECACDFIQVSVPSV